jgi:hypothetical protein
MCHALSSISGVHQLGLYVNPVATHITASSYWIPGDWADEIFIDSALGGSPARY